MPPKHQVRRPSSPSEVLDAASEHLGHVHLRCGHPFVTSVLTAFLSAQGCGAHVDSVSIRLSQRRRSFVRSFVRSQDALYASPRGFLWSVRDGRSTVTSRAQLLLIAASRASVGIGGG